MGYWLWAMDKEAMKESSYSQQAAREKIVRGSAEIRNLINLFLFFLYFLLASLTKSYKSFIYAFILPFLRSPKSITTAPRSPRIFPDACALNLN